MLGCVMFWIGVAGCVLQSEEPVPQPLEELEQRALGREDLTLALGSQLLVETDLHPVRFGSVRVCNMPQLAEVVGGLPVAQRPTERPVAGQRWHQRWLTRYVQPRPSLRTALLVSLRPPGEPQPIPGARGAMLQVRPDYVLVPDRVENVSGPELRGQPVRFVQDADGQVELGVFFPSFLDGLTVWCQLLVEDPRVAAGCVSTPMLEIHVGAL